MDQNFSSAPSPQDEATQIMLMEAVAREHRTRVDLIMARREIEMMRRQMDGLREELIVAKAVGQATLA